MSGDNTSQARADATSSPAEAKPVPVHPDFGLEIETFLRLAAPFDREEVKFKPGSVSGNRAMVLHYVDARVIQDRLDEVMSPWGWKNEYVRLDNNSVECRLSLKVRGEWITKADVGGESEQPDEGDRTKAAYSDSLKRAAVQWGIGRYLYRLPAQWCDYDPQKRKFVSAPPLPDWALPKAEVITAAQAAELRALLTENGVSHEQFCTGKKIPAVERLPAGDFLASVRQVVLAGRKHRAAATPAPTAKTNGAAQPAGAKA